jgi:hypothetical protein
MSSSSSSNQNPSAVLRALSSSLPPDTFIKLLENTLYPALDALPTAQKTAVSNSLTVAKRDSDQTRQKLDAIGYDTHKKSLEDAVRALNKDIKRNWKDGWEEQGEMMGEIAGEVLEWLPTLWRVAVKDGLELQLIQKCLLLCTETIHKVANSNSRSEFGDMDFEVTITDSKDIKIYEETHAGVDHTLAWMWKEILVAASAQGAATKAIESDIDRLKIKDDVYSFIRKDGGKSNFPFKSPQILTPAAYDPTEDSHHTGYSFWDEHWTPAMKDAASRLLIAQHTACIESFDKAPSFSLFTKLVNESPDLEVALLRATRNAIFPSTPSSNPKITYGVAADIFNAASQTEDLVQLLNALPRFSSDPTIPRAEQTIIKHLSKQSIPAHHKNTALDAIERGLNRAKQDTLDEVNRAFPGFDEAYEWLEEQIDGGKLTRKAPGGRRNYLDMTPAQRKLDGLRDEYLDKFVQRAARGNDEYGYGGTVDDFDDGMDGVDSDDSDYEEQRNARCPDLVKVVTSWVVVLQEWPDKEEAEKVWGRVKESDGKGDLLFAVDGVAESLASRYVRLHSIIPFIHGP